MNRGKHDIQKSGYYENNSPTQIITCGELLAFFFAFNPEGWSPLSSVATITSFTLTKVDIVDSELIEHDSIDLPTEDVTINTGSLAQTISFIGDSYVNVSAGLYQYKLTVSVAGLGDYNYESQPFLICGNDEEVLSDFTNEFTNEFR